MEKGKQPVHLSGRFDGGNPKSASHIRYDGDNTFTVRPTWESDPSRAYGLRFAVMLENPETRPTPLVLRVDWTTELHMEYKRVYYLSREGDEDWTEFDASVEGSVASLRLDADPGLSYVSLSPMYNYSNYLAFVDALRQRPEARLDLVGKSRQDREIWRIQIPPEPSADAEAVFFQCRNNAADSAGNFMVDGMVRFLFSGDPEAEELMRRFTFHFLPMTNPDGVFDGLERDTAVGDGAHLATMNTAPDPAHDAIRRTLEAVCPRVFVNLHNWMIPDVDGLLCNDELYARRLSDLLPRVGRIPKRYHREWYAGAATEVVERGDDTIYPISRLPELHKASGGTWKDFCRERFDARAMSVEFPWHGRTVEDMRNLGSALLEAVCIIRLAEQ